MLPTSYGWFSKRPKSLQFLNKPIIFLVTISFAAFFQGAIINGFVNVSLTSIETRFGLSSTSVGFIPSSYDVAGIFTVIPLSYFGGRSSQTRILSICLAISSVGAAVMFLPHLFTLSQWSTMDGLKELEVASVGFCGSSATVDGKVDLQGWVTVFYLGMMIMGVGFSPLWTNTFDYMDKNIPHSDFPVYSAIFTLAGIVGPGFGYLMGGYFLSLPFDDVFRKSEFYKNMTNPEYDTLAENASFIGAYWIGFLISSVGLFLIALPVGGFPYEFPNSQQLREQKVNEAFGAETVKEESKLATSMSWSDFKTGSCYILSNPIVMLIAFAGACEGFFLATLSSFGPKYLEVVFNFTSSEAAIAVGLVLVPTATLALILGGVIPKVCSMTSRHLLVLCFVSAALTFGSCFGLLSGCSQADIITPNNVIFYKGADCDISSCGCDRINYKPYCLDDKTVLISPCYYGCNNGTLSNCLCFNSAINSNLNEGSCDVSNFCTDAKFYLSFLFFALASFTVFFNVPAAESALDRSVEPNMRSLAFGFDIFIMRVFGTIPAPLIVGAIFDSKCILWQETTTGDKGSCLRYDESVAKAFTTVCIISTGLMTLCFLVALLVHVLKQNNHNRSVTPVPIFNYMVAETTKPENATETLETYDNSSYDVASDNPGNSNNTRISSPANAVFEVNTTL